MLNINIIKLEVNDCGQLELTARVEKPMNSREFFDTQEAYEASIPAYEQASDEYMKLHLGRNILIGSGD